jgi:hypothetical protein
MSERDDSVMEHGPHARRVEDPAGRPTPFVEGPTGPAPVSSELRGDPGEDGERRAESGAVAGAVAGTGAAGPLGGMVGAVAGGLAGTAAEVTADDRDPDGEESTARADSTRDEGIDGDEPPGARIGSERVVTENWPDLRRSQDDAER